MEVIAQNAEGVDYPSETGAGFAKRIFKRLRSAHRFEEVAPVVAAVDDVVLESAGFSERRLP